MSTSYNSDRFLESHLYMLTRTKEGLSRKSVVKMVEDPRILAIHDSVSSCFAEFSVMKNVSF